MDISPREETLQRETRVTWFLEEKPLHSMGVFWLAIPLQPNWSLDNEPAQTQLHDRGNGGKQ
jgi:hypothetical protein